MYTSVLDGGTILSTWQRDWSGSMIRSIKLQVNINRVERENVSITFRKAACPWIVMKSASSKITTLILFQEAELANPFTFSRIVSIPFSSDAFI